MFDWSISDLRRISYSEILPLVTVGSDQRIITEGPGACERTGDDCPSGTKGWIKKDVLPFVIL
jgi:hypothetical protein